MTKHAPARIFQLATWWLVVGLILYLLYEIFAPFLPALAWAVVVASFFHPLHGRLGRLVPNASLSAVLMVLAVTVALVLPGVWLASVFAAQASVVISTFSSPGMWSKMIEVVDTHLRSVDLTGGELQKMIMDSVQQTLGVLAKQSARLAGGLARFAFQFLIFLIALFYLFRDGPALVALLKDIAPVEGEASDRMIAEAAEVIRVVLLSGFVVSAAQGLMGGLMFWMLGLPSPAFWGVVCGILAFLPVIGPSLVWGPAGIWLILTGEPLRGAALLVIGFLLVSSSDKLLRPLLIAGRARMNELLVLISLLGGVQVFGFLGLVLGPLVVATVGGMLKGYRDSLLEHRAAS